MDQALQPEDELAPCDPRNFDQRPIWQRMLIIAAGPFMNFLLAFLLIAGYYMTTYVPPTIASVNVGSPAEQGGLIPGDVIVEVEGAKTATVEEVIQLIMPRSETETVVVVRRGTERISSTVTPRYNPDAGVGLIG